MCTPEFGFECSLLEKGDFCAWDKNNAACDQRAIHPHLHSIMIFFAFYCHACTRLYSFPHKNRSTSMFPALYFIKKTYTIWNSQSSMFFDGSESEQHSHSSHYPCKLQSGHLWKKGSLISAKHLSQQVESLSLLNVLETLQKWRICAAVATRNYCS